MKILLVLVVIFHMMLIDKEKKLKANKIKSNGGTLLLAHRGLRSLHLENTLEAIDAAFKEGVDGVEFDVQLTSDNIPVVIHDQKLKRLFGINEKIDNKTYQELSALSLHEPGYVRKYKMPTLLEVLSICPEKKLINIELKETTKKNGKISIEEVLGAIEPFKNKLNIVISSFDPEILRMVYEINQDYLLGALIKSQRDMIRLLSASSTLGIVDFINPHISLINDKSSKTLKLFNVPLIFWGYIGNDKDNQVMRHNHYALISDI